MINYNDLKLYLELKGYNVEYASDDELISMLNDLLSNFKKTRGKYYASNT